MNQLSLGGVWVPMEVLLVTVYLQYEIYQYEIDFLHHSTTVHVVVVLHVHAQVSTHQHDAVPLSLFYRTK